MNDYFTTISKLIEHLIACNEAMTDELTEYIDERLEEAAKEMASCRVEFRRDATQNEKEYLLPKLRYLWAAYTPARTCRINPDLREDFCHECENWLRGTQYDIDRYIEGQPTPYNKPHDQEQLVDVTKLIEERLPPQIRLPKAVEAFSRAVSQGMLELTATGLKIVEGGGLNIKLLACLCGMIYCNDHDGENDKDYTLFILGKDRQLPAKELASIFNLDYRTFVQSRYQAAAAHVKRLPKGFELIKSLL